MSKVAILARVSPELRAAIEAEAKRDRRSISQVVELWLEAGMKAAAEAEKIATSNRLVEMMRQPVTGPPQPVVRWPVTCLTGGPVGSEEW